MRVATFYYQFECFQNTHSEIVAIEVEKIVAILWGEIKEGVTGLVSDSEELTANINSSFNTLLSNRCTIADVVDGVQQVLTHLGLGLGFWFSVSSTAATCLICSSLDSGLSFKSSPASLVRLGEKLVDGKLILRQLAVIGQRDSLFGRSDEENQSSQEVFPKVRLGLG